MTKGGVEIVAPHQNYHPAAKPDAFGVSGRAVDGLRRFNEFVGFALAVLGRFRRWGRICCAWLGLFLGAKVAALGKSAADTEQEGKPGDGEVTQNRTLNLKHPSTHKFPDLFAVRGPLGRACLMPFK